MSPVLFAVLAHGPGGLSWARSRGGLMVYAELGHALGAAKLHARELARRGHAGVALRIVGVAAEADLGEAWESAEHTEVVA